MTPDKKYVETPLMKQYYGVKAVHPDAILLFRVGDFYETFGADAIRASGILGITLTRRANGAGTYVELAGFPYHSLDTYLPKLVRAGERVAVCEQLEDPKGVKGIVKRGVIELVTPGVALSDNILEYKENTFLAAVYFGPKTTGVSFLDISTGEFYAAQGSDVYVDKLLSNFAPKEIVYQRSAEGRFKAAFGDKHYTYKLDEWVFSHDLNAEKLCRQFGTASLKGFGINDMPDAVAAAGAILYYLEFTEHRSIGHITSIARIDEDRYVWIDRFTIRNLELFAPRTGFAAVMDRTQTAMGGRLLKKWIALPIKDVAELDRRLDIVGHFKENEELREDYGQQLGLISDLERIVSRIAARRVMPREVVQLKNSLDAVARAKTMLASSADARLQQMAAQLDTLDGVRERIGREIYPDPSNQLAKGGVIADGVNLELDDLRRIARHGKEVIAGIQQRESEATGIPSLKISFNNVFGYYIEVRNTHKDKVPEEWIRKQTLTAAERYITQELKEYEEKILGAEEKMIAIEQELYNGMMDFLGQYLGQMQHNAAIVAQTDCLVSFAVIAAERNYTRPTLDEGKVLDIKEGRHPVIETLLPVGEPYIPNDIYLDDERQQIMMITGPNMAGKSALLRQTALIVLMAQTGSFVPAFSARIGIVDKIFTRVGASDNISQGESTFMVEMLESASILNNVSERSLLLLDEIGRGTSTYDGISIAWSMVEYLHNHPSRAKTLFATHYHELNELEQTCPRVRNYNVSVKEVDRSIVFLRKLVAGGTEHSFGIHVARMAGMPRWIVDRAGELLERMESERRGIETPATAGMQAASSGGLTKAQAAGEMLRGDAKKGPAAAKGNASGRAPDTLDGAGGRAPDTLDGAGGRAPNTAGSWRSDVNRAPHAKANASGGGPDSAGNSASQVGRELDGASARVGQERDDWGRDAVRAPDAKGGLEKNARPTLDAAGGRTPDAKGGMENNARPTLDAAGGRAPGPAGIQLSMFQLDDPVLKQIRDEIKGLDINSLTPLEALNKLSEIKKITGI